MAPEKTLLILDGYEGLGGFRDGRYFPYHGGADRAGVLTIGRGHVLSAGEIARGTFDHGLTLEQVNQIFDQDLKNRDERLKQHLVQFTNDQHAAALASFYNNEEMWIKGTPGHMHRAGKFERAAEAILWYVKSNGQTQRGLWRRQMTVSLCYLSGIVMIAKDLASEKHLEDTLGKLIPCNRPAF